MDRFYDRLLDDLNNEIYNSWGLSHTHISTDYLGRAMPNKLERKTKGPKGLRVLKHRWNSLDDGTVERRRRVSYEDKDEFIDRFINFRLGPDDPAPPAPTNKDVELNLETLRTLMGLKMAESGFEEADANVLIPKLGKLFPNDDLRRHASGLCGLLLTEDGNEEASLSDWVTNEAIDLTQARKLQRRVKDTMASTKESDRDGMKTAAKPHELAKKRKSSGQESHLMSKLVKTEVSSHDWFSSSSENGAGGRRWQSCSES
ncbi:hypothetical protein K470DRAFT_264530 [Piedraia hortae CBS 480.64]|uniref:Uncharacterized protein n=1 Tax=Piedraia hortae CBS 480.64 TaxID=1314780 RepID=A0A6A7C103_9PEZI|nr:hypothetical protein K470DRAFT_264530 [Piedraia hortae CBS 480.64]